MLVPFTKTPGARAVEQILALGPAAWYTPETIQQDRSSQYSDLYVFNASLKNSLVLDRGTGSPTFTRADASTCATVVDHEGIIRTVPANCARFTGARLVRNLVATKSEDFSNAAWTKTTTTATATTLTATAGNATTIAAAAITSASQAHVLRVQMSRITGTGNIQLTLDNGSTWTTVTLTGTDQVFSISQTLANPQPGIRIVTNGDAINATKIQVQAKAGASDSTVPDDYVSVGVLSSPYHGAGIDGVKYFTTTNGNTVASNVVTEATGTAIADATLKGYLSEGSRTNLCLQSEDFSTTWLRGASEAITTNATTAPDGTVTADLIKHTVSATDTFAFRYQAITLATTTAHTFSIFAKKKDTDFINITVYDGTVGVRYWFNINVGTVASTVNIGAGMSGVSASINVAANGFYRCVLAFTSTAVALTSIYISATDADASLNLSSGLGNYFWGAQLEAASFASSYIPTTTASVTRAADVLTYPTSGNMSSTVGTCYAEVSTGLTGSINGYHIVSSINGTEGIPMYINTGNLAQYDGTAARNFIAYTPSATIQMLATVWSGSVNNGAIGGTLGTPAVFDGNLGLNANFAIGAAIAGGNQWFGNIRNVKIWTTALPKYVLQTLTGGTGPSTSALTAAVWEDASGNGRPLEQITSANQPIYLASAASLGVAKYAYLPGVAGNYFSTPDSVANSITGDIDIRAYVALDDWTPAALSSVVAKLNSDTGYQFSVNTTGVLVFKWQQADTTVLLKTSTVAPTVSNAAALWVRVTLDVDNGAAGNDVTFYTSTDGSTWTQLGTTVTTAGVTNIKNTADSVELMSDSLGLDHRTTGKCYRAQIYNGINGTLAVDFNPSTFSETGTNGTTAVASTGETWTLNSTGAKPAQIVRDASLLGDGTNHYMKTSAFTLNQPVTVYLVGKQISWTANDSLLDGNANTSMRLLQQTASPGIALQGGATPLAPNNDLAVGSYGVMAGVFSGASSLFQINAGTAITGSPGTTNPGAITIMSQADGLGTYANVQYKEIIVFPAAHDAATRELVRNLLNAKYASF